MASVVTIMDRASFTARTDVIVVVDPGGERLIWVPRDLWCPASGRRVNEAYTAGGHEALRAALAEHDLAVQHGLCLSREAVESGLEGVELAMPVERPMAFWYPLSPQAPIDDGRKLVRFEAPVDRLRGDRIHQWLGARYGLDQDYSGDLPRLRRQQQLVAVMLGDGFDFGRFIDRESSFELSDLAAFDDLRRVRPLWRIETFGPTRPAVIGDRQVLVSAR